MTERTRWSTCPPWCCDSSNPNHEQGWHHSAGWELELAALYTDPEFPEIGPDHQSVQVYRSRKQRSEATTIDLAVNELPSIQLAPHEALALAEALIREARAVLAEES